MAYRLLSNEGVSDAVRRIALEQIDKALAEVDDKSIDRGETVHQVRKRCKKLRGLVRLVRPALGDTYQQENRTFRDASRILSPSRDAEVLVKTFEGLMDDVPDRKAHLRVRNVLQDRLEKTHSDESALDDRLARFRNIMTEARKRVEKWSLNKVEIGDALQGYAKTYRRGRTAMADASDGGKSADFHDWRKRVKYHGYHTRLLRQAWEPVMKTLSDETGELGDLLGDDHDLAVLRNTILAEPDTFGSEKVLHHLLEAITKRQKSLRGRARETGARIFASKPKRQVQRLECWLSASRSSE